MTVESSRDAGLHEVRDLVLATATVQGRQIDVDGVLVALAGAVRAFTRRRTAPPPSPAALCRRVQQASRALMALEDALYGLERDEAALPRLKRPSVALWGSPEEFEGWRARLQALRVQADLLLDRQSRSSRPGPRRDRAVHRLVLDVAWILHREGLRVTTYPDGLLAQVATAAARAGGHELPVDRWLQRLLRPAVLFLRHGGVPPSRDTNSAITEAPSDFVRSRPKGVH